MHGATARKQRAKPGTGNGPSGERAKRPLVSVAAMKRAIQFLRDPTGGKGLGSRADLAELVRLKGSIVAMRTRASQKPLTFAQRARYQDMCSRARIILRDVAPRMPEKT